MNPYAPPQTQSVRSESGGRSLRGEANVRGIGLFAMCSSTVHVGSFLAERSTLRWGYAVVALFGVITGVSLLRLESRGRGWWLASSVLGWTVSALYYALHPSRLAPRTYVVHAFGAAIALWLLWYLFVGGGARVLTRDYRKLLGDRPDPPPAVAGWARVLSALVLIFYGSALVIGIAARYFLR